MFAEMRSGFLCTLFCTALFCTTLFCTTLIVSGASPVSAAKPLRVYLGTYTGPAVTDAKGIYLTELNPEDGTLAPPRLVAECANPAFLALHPFKPLLYAVGEGGQGVVRAYSLDTKTGDLVFLNEETVPGEGACHLCVCCSREDLPASVAVACYGSGTVHLLPIRDDGRLDPCSSTIRHSGEGPNTRRQLGPHAHAVYHLPVAVTDKFVIEMLVAVDLGVDKVYHYLLDQEKKEIVDPDTDLGEDKRNDQIALPPGSGPRHLAQQLTLDNDTDKTGHVMSDYTCYILNELDSTVCVYDGERILQTLSTLPEGVQPADCDNATAEVFLHPGGRFLYASNRGHDSIALFTVAGKMVAGKTVDTNSLDTKNEKAPLTFVECVPSGGKHPRSFNLSPCGNWLIAANMNTNDVATFKIDRTTGRLTPTGKRITVNRPVCVLPVRE